MGNNPYISSLHICMYISVLISCNVTESSAIRAARDRRDYSNILILQMRKTKTCRSKVTSANPYNVSIMAGTKTQVPWLPGQCSFTWLKDLSQLLPNFYTQVSSWDSLFSKKEPNLKLQKNCKHRSSNFYSLKYLRV